MENTLVFSVNNIQLMDNIEKSLFRKVKIKAFATGENCHTMPIEEDTLKRGAKTIYNKPILWKYNKYFDDAMGHEKDEVPCGFVPETNDNPIRFETDKGRLYIVIYALLWTKYCGKLIDIFERDNNKKDVSVEIAVIEDEENNFSSKPKIKDFVIAGITLLGEMVNPACKGCEAELLEFSENKSEFLKNESMINFESEIKIENSKEFAVDGKWENPRRKLFTPLSKQPNKKSLLSEAYLVTDFKDDSIQITKFKYPHHIIKDGNLVVHKTGLTSAFKRATQQNIINNENIKKHIMKHYKELGLSQENFSDFDLNEEEFNIYFSKEFKRERVGDLGMADNKEMKEETKEEKMQEKKVEEVKEECKKMADEEKVEEVKEECKKMEEDERDEETDKEDAHDEDDNHDEDDEHKDENMSEEDKDAKIKEMSEKIDKLEEENKAYMSKIESMSDYEELKKFKADTEERQMREEEMRKMTTVMEEIENRGVRMSEDDKKTLMAKVKEFSSLDAWSNYVKAQAFDMRENTDGVVKFALPYAEKNSTGSIWDKF